MEREKGCLTSGAFAALCGTTKETLRHYKDIGLLSPVHRGDNGYFYYDVEQFYDFYAIAIFRQTGTPLEEIRRLAIPAEELEGLTDPPASEDETLIRVLERCQALCVRYGIQTDFLLGAVHQPDSHGRPGAISHLYTRIKEKADGNAARLGWFKCISPHK